MSGSARRRGRGRARGQPGETSDASERLNIPAGGFDGPASRGSGSGTSGRAPSAGSPGRGAAPSGGFASQGSGAGSRRSSNSAPSQPPSQGPSQGMPRFDPALDPSRVPKATDALKNVDLPASFFNLDRSVSNCPSSSVLFLCFVTCAALHTPASFPLSIPFLQPSWRFIARDGTRMPGMPMLAMGYLSLDPPSAVAIVCKSLHHACLIWCLQQTLADQA